MVAPAPPIEPVLAALQELIRPDDVIVGHNVGFDVGFLDAALTRHGWPRLGRRTVDTVRIARRLLAGEVPDCRLGTLASWLRLPHQPCHRALATSRPPPTAAPAPRARRRARDHRSRRSPVAADHRRPSRGGEARPHRRPAALARRVPLPRPRRDGPLRREGDEPPGPRAPVLRPRRPPQGRAPPARHPPDRSHPLRSPLHAAVLEVRLIRRHRPRFNQVANHPEAAAYLRIGGTAGRPKLTVTKSAATGGPAWLLGPFAGQGGARAAAAALGEACAALDPSVPLVRDTVLDRPDHLLSAHAEHLLELAQQERFEEAAAARDRAAVLARAVTRQRRAEQLLALDRLELVWRAPGGPVRSCCTRACCASTPPTSIRPGFPTRSPEPTSVGRAARRPTPRRPTPRRPTSRRPTSRTRSPPSTGPCRATSPTSWRR